MSSFAPPSNYAAHYSAQPCVCYRIPPAWALADQIACSSVGKISAHGKDLGCGVLIGIDRVLVPAHVIANICSDSLQVSFYSPGRSYWVLTFFIDEALDLAILQLDRSIGRFPGQVHPFPYLNAETLPRNFLLGRFDGEVPYSVIENGYSCYGGSFCSFVPTEQGCSGSGYFDQNGALFALHLSRSNNSCSNIPREERKAVLVSQMKKSAQLGWVFSVSPCARLVPPPVRFVCANGFHQQSCFTAEKKSGGRPAETRTIEIFGKTYKYWEYRPKNSVGPGPRGITMSIPGQHQKITYRFNEQVHDMRGYNKNPDEVYTAAAKAFKIVFERTRTIPSAFTFQSDLGPLGATLI